MNKPLLSRTEFLLVAGALALAALSLLFPSTPSYDPWAWIIWGREVLHLELDTLHGPSWKPLPVLFTTPFALAGDAAPELWLVVARAGGLLALAFAFRLASRLVGGGRQGAAAGVLAVLGIALTANWLENVGLGYSEGLLTALLLLAVDRHLDRRPEHALVLGFLAALLRPEVWPFLGLYGIWMWLRRPERRRLLVVLALLIPALWFVPELWGSGDAFRASSRAQEVVGASPALTDEPARELLRRAEAYLPDPVVLGFALALVLGLLARRRADVFLALATLAWIGLVAVMTSRGYAGNERYLAFPLALAAVMAGVGWTRLAGDAAALARRRGLARAPVAAGVLAATLLALAVVASDAPEKASALPDDARALRYQGRLYDDLAVAVERAGGSARVLDCGRVVTGPYQVPALAWELDTHVGQVHIQETYPGTLFSTRSTQRAPLVPATPDGRGFDRLAATRDWHVYGDCTVDRSATFSAR